MKTKKRKSVRCPDCAEIYSASNLRCPLCELPNPKMSAFPVSPADRVVGIALLILGILTAIPFFVLPYGFGTIPRLRGSAIYFAAHLIPPTLMLNGILLLCGIHPRDFYHWWEHRNDFTKGIILVAGLLLIALAIVVYWLITFEAEPEWQEL